MGDNGYYKIHRGEDLVELFRHPLENNLLSFCAYRAKRTNSFSAVGLEKGEALVGDHRACGLSRQEYRTALKNLEKWKFLTIRTTNKGTIVKLTNSNVYDINEESTNQQANQSPTITQPSPNHHPTTNKNDKNERMEEKVKTLVKKSFTVPSLEEITKYCQERKNDIDPEYFLDSNNAKGWVIGKNQTPAKDWKAMIRTWEKSSFNQGRKMEEAERW